MSPRGKSLISILLLIFFFPLGIVVMWLIAPWSRSFKIALTVLFFLPFIFTLGLLIRNNSQQSAPTTPSTQTKTYSDPKYNLTFNYPDGWFIRVDNTSLSPVLLSRRALSSSLEVVNVTDKVYSAAIGEVPPTCKFIVSIHQNPKQLTLSEWQKRSVNEDLSAPADESDPIYKSLIHPMPTNVNGMPAVLILGNTYLLGKGSLVYKIEQDSHWRCSPGYQTILNSLTLQ